MKNNKKLIISIVLSLVLLLSGTYAVLIYLTEQTDITMVIDGDQVTFDAGQNITVTDLVPTYSMEDGLVKTIEVYKENGEYNSGIDLFLKLKSWPSALSDASFRYALYKNDTYLSSGSFSGKKQGDVIKLTNYTQQMNLEENKDTYKVYMWMDAYAASNVNMMNQTFTISLYGEVSFYEINEVIASDITPNAPDLAEGMIPVRYDYRTDEWVKADTTNANNSWYDYYNQKWANAVLVDSAHRDSYMNASVDTPVPEEHIMAYYVWIPRYKYVLFNVNSEIMDPKEIQIEFEKTTDPVSIGVNNGDYHSHPAFWWDNNSDGIRESSEELAGIWVGKFETSGTVNEPYVKPNMNSAVNLKIYNLFTMNKNIQSTNYLTEQGTTQADIHMIKNTDWGAIAYLSHSKYGINTEIAINDNSSMVTGRQGNYTYNDFIITDGYVTENKMLGTGTRASTTGNVYGVYDMSGGAYEYVMALRKISDSDETPYYQNSGFDSNNMPLSKYYDLYEYVSSSLDHSKRVLGDATGETSGWYDDYKNFTYSSYGWFRRGGYFGVGTAAGVFYFNAYNGHADANYSSRSVIVLP